jgi:hypothetical protein
MLCSVTVESVTDHFALTAVVEPFYRSGFLRRIVTRGRGPLRRQIASSERLKEDSTVLGFNVGFNSGVIAGQTVMHYHVHVIPRRMGDNPNPRGGIRGIILGKAD